MTKAIDTIKGYIDRKAYGWLEEIDFDMLTFIEQAVEAGNSPDEIRDAIAKTCSAYGGEYADLCRSTARRVQAQKQRA